MPAKPRTYDVYLSPHADDTCFSLGLLASTRGAGTLLTVFTTSRFVQQSMSLSGDPDERVDQVTTLRRLEDRRFAETAGLRLDHVGFLDAPLRGRKLTDRAMVSTDADAIEARLIERVGAGGRQGLRPWLFCPMGIGGHIDHLAVREVVLRNLALLRETHRLAFYEELPYASHPRLRYEGMRRFCGAWPSGWPLERHVLRFGGAAQKKLTLIRGYASQFRKAPPTLAPFQPADVSAAAPCECVWMPRRQRGFSELLPLPR